MTAAVFVLFGLECQERVLASPSLQQWRLALTSWWGSVPPPHWQRTLWWTLVRERRWARLSTSLKNAADRHVWFFLHYRQTFKRTRAAPPRVTLIVVPPACLYRNRGCRNVCTPMADNSYSNDVGKKKTKKRCIWNYTTTHSCKIQNPGLSQRSTCTTQLEEARCCSFLKRCFHNISSR